MEVKTFLEHLDVRPFVPFTIELDNGRRATVRHPEDVIICPNRMKLWWMEAYDEERDICMIFHPSAVSALLKERGNGG